MKMSEKAFQNLRTHIEPLDTLERRDQYRNGDFPNAAAVKDLNKRYRWDLLWASGVSSRDISDLYRDEDLNDAHIDTALRRIVVDIVI